MPNKPAGTARKLVPAAFAVFYSKPRDLKYSRLIAALSSGDDANCSCSTMIYWMPASSVIFSTLSMTVAERARVLRDRLNTPDSASAGFVEFLAEADGLEQAQFDEKAESWMVRRPSAAGDGL